MKSKEEELQTVITAEGKGKKKILFIIVGMAIVLILGIALSVTALGGGSAKKVAEQLNLGHKYLDELDFERAIVAYEAVLEIDPKNAEAYLGLIEIYGAQEDAGQIAEIYLKAESKFTGDIYLKTAGDGEKDAEELKKVQAEAAAQLESLVKAAVAAGEYTKAEDHAAQLAKVDEAKAAQFVPELKGVGTGEVITFGHYEQDNDTSNGAEPIEWMVLKREEGRALVISRYALDCRKYNEELTRVIWGICTLRGWLNDSFYNTAFDASEKEKIVQVTNANPDSYAFYNSDYAIDTYITTRKISWTVGGEPLTEEILRSGGANAGNATADNVFLLSWEEALNYFASDDARRCHPTAYAIAQGAWSSTGDSTGRCYWWLRSPGINRYDALFVGGCGVLSHELVPRGRNAVRPALWIAE